MVGGVPAKLIKEIELRRGNVSTAATIRLSQLGLYDFRAPEETILVTPAICIVPTKLSPDCVGCNKLRYGLRA